LFVERSVVDLNTIPKTGLKQFIADLADAHGVSYVRDGYAEIAAVITRLSGDDVEPDETEKRVIALKRAGVIDGRVMVALLGSYFDEIKRERSADNQ
jgi:hypothetical protein